MRAPQKKGASTAPSGPTVTSVAPSLGDISGGGQLVTIAGTGFTGSPTVTFGGSSATSVTVVNSTTITCIIPAHASGLVDVAVGAGTLSNGFEYWSPLQVTGVDTYLDAGKGWSAGTSWTDQVVSSVWTLAGSTLPTQNASAFGTGVAGIFFDTALGRGQSTQRPAAGTFSSGVSIFSVAKWTSSDAAYTYAGFNVPLTIVGGYDAAGWGGFGASAGSVAMASYNNAGATPSNGTKGAGLNDGSAHLIGATYDTGNTVTYYADGSSLGTDSFASAYPSAWLRYWTVGQGYSAADGFDGTVGAIVIVNGIISSGDRTKLNTWAKQRFGTP